MYIAVCLNDIMIERFSVFCFKMTLNEVAGLAVGLDTFKIAGISGKL